MARLLVPALCAVLLVPAAAAGPPPVRPNAAQIGARTRAAVRASRARVVAIRVVGPNRRFAVRIEARDPAAYLRRRLNPVVEVVNRLTARLWRFHSRTFAVADRSGRVVFSLNETRRGGAESTRWFVRPGLEGCVLTVPFDIEVDPDGVAPPCPA